VGSSFAKVVAFTKQGRTDGSHGSRPTTG